VPGWSLERLVSCPWESVVTFCTANWRGNTLDVLGYNAEQIFAPGVDGVALALSLGSDTRTACSGASCRRRDMESKQILDKVVAELREIDVHLSGDSDLADVWEEIKEQVQHEPSFFWDAYLQTISSYIGRIIAELPADELQRTMASFKCSSRDRLQREVFRRLMLRAKRERMGYPPFDFKYFSYPVLDFIGYGHVLRRVGLYECEVNIYSAAAPFGEWGVINVSKIENVLSKDEFAAARANGWPEKWTREPDPSASAPPREDA